MKGVIFSIVVLTLVSQNLASVNPPEFPKPIPDVDPLGIKFDDHGPLVKFVYLENEHATLFYRDLRPTVEIKPGSSSPKMKDTVKCHYTGVLNDNGKERVFDSSYDGEPLEIGLSRVIKGWQYILQQMHCGQKWEVHIPSKLAYGSAGIGGVIPPNADLIFIIELLEVIPSSAKGEL